MRLRRVKAIGAIARGASATGFDYLDSCRDKLSHFERGLSHVWARARARASVRRFRIRIKQQGGGLREERLSLESRALACEGAFSSFRRAKIYSSRLGAPASVFSRFRCFAFATYSDVTRDERVTFESNASRVLPRISFPACRLKKKSANTYYVDSKIGRIIILSELLYISFFRMTSTRSWYARKLIYSCSYHESKDFSFFGELRFFPLHNNPI